MKKADEIRGLIDVSTEALLNPHPTFRETFDHLAYQDAMRGQSILSLAKAEILIFRGFNDFTLRACG